MASMCLYPTSKRNIPPNTEAVALPSIVRIRHLDATKNRLTDRNKRRLNYS